MIPWAPMLPTLVPAPFDSDDYVFEVKWDGLRCLCQLEAGTVRLFSRTGRDITGPFPELQDAAAAVSLRSAVMDGEICVIEGGVPSFHRVQRRLLTHSPAAVKRSAVKHPAVFMVFDLLEREGRPLLNLPWKERRAALEGSWRADTAHTALSPTVLRRGRDLYAAVVARGLEGIVAKRVDSPYVPGRRTRYWLKARRQQELDCVVGGYIPRGALDFKSLALGLYHGAELVYVGNVGTGFAEATRAELMRRLLPLRTARVPFATPPSARVPPGLQWVLPRLVVRVVFLEFTTYGHLRQPVFRGFRDDKAPEDCRAPSAGDRGNP